MIRPSWLAFFSSEPLLKPTSGSGLSAEVTYLTAATALNYFAYNFIKIHRTLHTSPAMAAGVTDRLWSVEGLVALWESYERGRNSCVNSNDKTC